jgi:CTD small phosphatase-like protein 2
MRFIEKMPEIPSEEILARVTCIDRKTEHDKVILFDLDETLVHCTNNSNALGPDIWVSVELAGGETVSAGINIRPYAKECLLAASKLFEVGVFTASNR